NTSLLITHTPTTPATHALTTTPGHPATPTLHLDEATTHAAITSHPTTPPATTIHPDTTAALIYTSGTTGRPKAALLTHHNLTALHTAWTHTHYTPTDHHRWLCLTSISFDVFTGDLIRALTTGGTLVLAPTGLQLDTAQWAHTLHTHHITALETAPRYIDQLTTHLTHTNTTLPHLRLLIATTDTWHTTAAHTTAQTLGPHTRLLTAYGITETTIDSTYSDLTAMPQRPQPGPTPIGAPLPNTRTYVLDAHLNLLPAGVMGELYIAGEGLARGYHHRPALTAERFIANPFDPHGGRLYRTGDRARRRPDGQLDFLGRTDHQIKLRGYRIEPAEIEHTLTTHPAITTALVTTHGQDDTR
ncbi:AMP-binding protein, partial [Microbispora sp. NPDC046973]|uniref:AMP-binding protein n=1 Tax=Microbispora sp. NPDC046973 TaxID=3155022 RepID=UPI0033F04CD1